MKVFRVIQKYYEIMGIRPANQSPPTHTFSERVVFGFLLFGYCIVAHLLYIIYLASGYMDYVECTTTTSGSIIAFVCFAAIALKSNVLFKIIDNAERFVVNS